MRHSALVYNGTQIAEKGERLNLTDMWRAAGSPEGHRPVDWLRLPQTERRIRHLEVTEKVGKSHLIQVSRGRNGATMAHWKLALEYAEDLSDELWSWGKDAIRDRMELRQGRDVIAPITADEALPRILGGVRGVVAKHDRESMLPAIDERLFNMMGQMLETIPVIVEAAARKLIEDQMPAIIEAHIARDPRRVGMPYMTSLDIAIREDVPQHQRIRIVRRITASLKKFCKSRNVEPVPDPRGTLMFPRATVAMWLDFGGRGLIQDHKAVLAGQGILSLPKPKKAKAAPATPEAQEAAHLKALSEIAEDRAQRIAAEVRPLEVEMQADALKVHEGRIIRDALKDGIRKVEAVAFAGTVMTRVYDIIGRAA